MTSEGGGGFFFGTPKQEPEERPPEKELPDTEMEVEAVEVDGEPVSRSEAKRLGFASIDNAREAKSATARLRLDHLPPDVGNELAQKLERSWFHLKRNEIDEALTLAQEVVWEYPTLAPAKLVIARCFINRREYEKGLNILATIPEGDRDAEILYFLGLCQSRIGKAKEAMDTLRRSAEIASDALIRKRATDLLQNVQGEQALCPICGKRTLYDSMVEAGDTMVCLNCAKKYPDGVVPKGAEEEEEEEDAADERGTRRRKRLRPPLSRTDVMLRLLFAVFLVFILALAVYLLYLLAPAQYEQFRSLIPDSVNFLPPGPYVQPQANAQRPAAPEPWTSPTLVFSSQPLVQAMAGVEVRRRLKVDRMENSDGAFKVTFRPAPAGPYTLNEKTGDFSWTPAPEDATKAFEISFAAVFKNNLRARDQISTITVSAGPEFRRLGGYADLNPAQTVHLLAEDMDGDGDQELVLFSGEYWRGHIVVFQSANNGEYRELSRSEISGRPVGAGVILADQEKWLALADYWNSRFRFFAHRNGKLAEMANTIDLPGPPILAGFNRDLSVAAALCRVDGGLRVVAHRQEGQLENRRIGEWRVPDDRLWRRILVLNAGGDNQPKILLLGGSFPSPALVLEPGKEPVPAPPAGGDAAGVLVEAAPARDGARLRCLAENAGRLRLIALNTAANAKPAAGGAVDAGPAPALAGIALGDLTGAGGEDCAILSSGRIGIAFAGAEDGDSPNMQFWPLPEPARLFGRPVVLGGGKGLVYVGESGGLWNVGIPK